MGQPKGKAKVKAAAKQKAKASALLARRLSPQGPNNPNAPRQRQASPGLEPQRQAGRAQSSAAMLLRRGGFQEDMVVLLVIFWLRDREKKEQKVVLPNSGSFLG